MTESIQPTMQKLFEAFDPKYKDKIHCQTCHGRSATDKTSFSQPSQLYPLDPKNMPSRNDPDPKRAAVVAFMEDKVMPQFSKLLMGQEVTCFTCHAQALGTVPKQQLQPAPVSTTIELGPCSVTNNYCPAGSKCYQGTCTKPCRTGECPSGYTCKSTNIGDLCVSTR
ncbi:MAG: hypothetical protein EP343_27000 [Deltaproteobacteria bacterium]|nr:MAG: hypothetical protein EP343_27000 [Deltaproteobacteria bacterium]